MTAIDIFLILIFIVSAALGFRKGIITQLGSVAAIVVAIIACRMFGQSVGELLFGSHPEWEGSSLTRYGVSIVSNCIVYIVVYYAVIIISRLLHTVTHAILLGPLDHIAGAAFSVAKYALVVSLALNLYIVCVPSTTLISKSRLCSGKAVELVIGFAPWLLDTLHPVEHDTVQSPTPVKV
ncbi:MAG: CvpA family protein [Staphylococcus sp.]|nr:CvpA family protein [Staphylococcus sp.]